MVPKASRRFARRQDEWTPLRMLAWAGIAALAGAAIFLVARGNWFGLLQMAVFLTASIAFVELEFGLPKFFDLVFVSAALLNAAGWVWNFYTNVPGYDEAAHFFTSFAFTLSFGYLAFDVVREHFAAILPISYW